jgi:hypothetical protein
MWVVCCQTGVVSNFVFWTFSYVVAIGLAWNFKISSMKSLKKFFFYLFDSEPNVDYFLLKNQCNICCKASL